MVILDTDHVSLLWRTTSVEAHRLRTRLEALAPEERVTTIITYEEQTRGWLATFAKARTLEDQIEAYRRLNRHLDNYRNLKVLDFDERAAVEYQRLKESRIRLGAMDLKIASIVLAHGGILLTRNSRDFRKVPRLRFEDWTV